MLGIGVTRARFAWVGVAAALIVTTAGMGQALAVAPKAGATGATTQPAPSGRPVTDWAPGPGHVFPGTPPTTAAAAAALAAVAAPTVDVPGPSGAAATSTAIAAGGYHTCVLLTSGTVACWGLNGNGQLGIGSTMDSLTMRVVPGLTNVVALKAGAAHTCALQAAGTIKCWGWNGSGQLGDGTTTDSWTPVAVSGIATAIGLSAGGSHTCAILSGGTAKCWGNNLNGQLGDGTLTPSSTPVTVSTLTTVTAIAAGGYHSCARLASGQVTCWGLNYFGQLGNGTGLDSPVPVFASGISTATDLLASSFHSCAVLTGGAVRCWGRNDVGQVGDGTALDRWTPVAVPGITGAAAVTGRGPTTCALLAAGGLWCWGYNEYGELGANSVGLYLLDPVQVAGVSTATASSGGNYHACAVLAGGNVACWGLNDLGQLGTATNSDSSVPALTHGFSRTTAVTGGAQFSCALQDGSVHCWGRNQYGQLGNGNTTGQLVPQLVTGISTATGIAADEFHACAVLANGTVKCWGDNRHGAIGDGTTTDSSVPVTVSGITTASAISLGQDHSCALLNNGTVKCWGANGEGQLGDGSTTERLTPVTVSGITTATYISAGMNHTCAVLASGAVECWGDNSFLQLGDGSGGDQATPVAAEGVTGATAVAAGMEHTCALVAGGAVTCWGSNGYGQLGQPGGELNGVPTAVEGLAGAVQIDAGARYNCARMSAGTIQCWGEGGQLGNGSPGNSSVPATVSTIVTAQALGAGLLHVCAVQSGGVLLCWGTDFEGELGRGSPGQQALEPVPVRYVGAAPPATPSGISAVYGDRSVTVAWPIPNDGGAPITSVTVTASPGGNICTATTAPTCTIGNLTNGTAYSVTMTATNIRGTSAASSPVAATGATYVPIAPIRLLDSRIGNGFAGPLYVGSALSFQVTGRGGIPASAVAVTGNLTVTGATAGGWLSLTPTHDNNPSTSTLNFPAGDTRANGVTVPLGLGGFLSVVYNGPGGGNQAHAIFDVTGYFTATGTGATYTTVTPARLLDSRSGNGFSGALSVGVARSFQVTGRAGVPGNATAVTGNLTVTGASGAGWVSLTPNLDNAPSTSTLNFPVGDDRANGVAAPLGGGGILSLAYNGPAAGNTVHVIFDVTGYFVPGSSGAKYVPVSPTRLLDSRTGNGFSGTLGVQSARGFQVTGRASVPPSAVAATGNLTVTGQTAAGWLSLTPTLDNNPPTSTLNFPVGDDRANGVAVPLGGTGLLSVAFNGPSAGNATNVIFDVTGYFMP